jgi:hypothetical protein
VLDGRAQDRSSTASRSDAKCAIISHGRPAFPGRPRRQPAPPARAPAREGGARREPARARGRGDRGGRPHARGRRPALGDRRRVHRTARRDQHGRGQAVVSARVPHRRWRHGCPDARLRARHREGPPRAHDLRRGLRALEFADTNCGAEADDSLAEHGLPAYGPAADRLERLSGPRGVLGRSRRRLPRGDRAALCARLHLPPDRRRQPGDAERPGAANPARGNAARTPTACTSSSSAGSTRRSRRSRTG